MKFSFGFGKNVANVNLVIDVLFSIMTARRTIERLKVDTYIVEAPGEVAIGIYALCFPVGSSDVAVLCWSSGHIESFHVFDFPLKRQIDEHILLFDRLYMYILYWSTLFWKKAWKANAAKETTIIRLDEYWFLISVLQMLTVHCRSVFAMR